MSPTYFLSIMLIIITVWFFSMFAFMLWDSSDPGTPEQIVHDIFHHT
jgi:hypothetical protein